MLFQYIMNIIKFIPAMIIPCLGLCRARPIRFDYSNILRITSNSVFIISNHAHVLSHSNIL